MEAIECPSTDKWIKKMWYLNTMQYYSAITKNKIRSFAETWMNLETVMQSEVSQKEKNKYHILTHICIQMNRFAGQKLRHRCREQTYGHQGRKVAGGGFRGGVMNQEIGIDIYTLICIKWITNKNLLYKKINKIKFKKQNHK